MLHIAAQVQGTDKLLIELLKEKCVEVHPRTINNGHRYIMPLLTPRDEAVKLLIDTGGARVDSLTNEAFTPLHYAAAVLSPECCGALIDRHANVNAINYYNETPFDCVGTLIKRELQCEQKKAKVEYILSSKNAQERLRRTKTKSSKKMTETAVKRR